MSYSNEQFNIILSKYKKIADEISKNNNYDTNIRHLLYIIIPAFIIKYGIDKENIIVLTFKNINIIINDVQDNINPALFSRRILKRNDEYQVIKKIIIKKYSNVPLMELLDSLIHEFNHAINSIKNELFIKYEQLYLRTGLSYSRYSKDLALIETVNTTLEEIINTRQTELIINIIKEMSKYNIDDYEIKTTIYNIEQNYKSNAYFLQSYFCKKIINNKTFINTLEILRINGETENIDEWFNSITEKENSFKNLNGLLNDSLEKEKELANTNFFKKRKINHIKNNLIKIKKIITVFNNNCNYK